jgi:beta-glucosidase
VGAGVKTLYEVTPLEGLKNRIGDKAEIIYAQGYSDDNYGFGRMFRRRSEDEIRKEQEERQLNIKRLADEAVKTAQKADIVLFIGGNNRTVETEGSDRTDIKLPYGQEELLARLAEVNPVIITVLVSGAPNDLNIAEPLSKALLISWFNGTEGGNALADILTGNISPSGRLPFSWPVRLEDSPAFALGNYSPGQGRRDIFAGLVEGNSAGDDTDEEGANSVQKDPNDAYYSEESLVGYRWYDTKNIPVMYPFGYGLTYTTFDYSAIDTDKEKYGKKDVIKVSVEIKNTGTVSADELVQVYIHRINPSVEWPYKELKAFSRVTPEPGESKTVVLDIPVRELRYWNETTHSWTDDPCDIEILVAASAGDVKLKKQVTLK